ncbi:NUDIX domain-containing protein [Poseidonocella sp. HB161398]|uniref:NUDIX domain-containing protein n=1 Tax=Poseidonocella sp. HB161398 TaxID=2320855 RepID=UPI0035176C69
MARPRRETAFLVRMRQKARRPALPGSRIEPGGSAEGAAARESVEETGRRSDPSPWSRPGARLRYRDGGEVRGAAAVPAARAPLDGASPPTAARRCGGCSRRPVPCPCVAGRTARLRRTGEWP